MIETQVAPKKHTFSESISLLAAARMLPGDVHENTVRRWAKDGVQGVVLDTWMIGGRRYTSEQAILDFVDQLTAVKATGG